MKRTNYSQDFKIQVVKEAMETGNTAAVAHRYELSPNMLQGWVKEMENGKFGDVDHAIFVMLPKLLTYRFEKAIGGTIS